MKNNVLLLLLLGLILFRPVSQVYEQREKFFSTGYEKTYQSLTEKYNASQYHQKKNPVIMSDAEFEQFAGGAFLKGLNPILIVHDHPPLGRYVVSLSILLFDNAHTIIVFVMLINVLGMYVLSRKVLGSSFLALIPLGLLVNEPIFLTKLEFTPLPEPIQLPFILFAFYFFLRGIESKKDIGWFLLTAVMLGGVISTRFFVLGTAITGTFILYLFLTYRFKPKTLHFLASLPIALVVLVLSYFRTIMESHSVLQVLSIQKYILDYHKSKFVLPFSFWDLIMFNRWHTWWDNRAIIKDILWVLTWPIATVLTGAFIIQSAIKKLKDITEPEKVLMLWVLVHVTMLSTGYTSSRYFLPLLPMLYILATAFIVELAVHLFPNTFGQKTQKKTTK
jgi:hypothetical protein